MLSSQEVANYLTKGLDEIGERQAVPYAFSILAEVGKGEVPRKVTGMVLTRSAERVPVSNGYTEVKYAFEVQLFAEGGTNYNYMHISDIVGQFINENQNTVVQFDGGQGIVTFTGSVPGNYKIEYGLGEGVPIIFTVYVTYTENAVTSGDKHWLLDGVEIPYLSESVSVEREGISRKVYTEVYSKVLLTGQTKFYTFRIPYESTTFYKLQTEILKSPTVGGIVHTLTYYDGVAFTQENPYVSKVSIYRSANSASTRPNGSTYDVTFSDVYEAEGNPLQYFISLIDFPFDMQGDDTRYFNSVAEQTEYFEAKATASTAPFVEVKAPNLDNLVITQQVYYNPTASAITQFDYASKNYAVIKVVSSEKTYYFYYFIEKSTIGADGFILCDLRLDSVQTYFFNPEITFSDCLIERAHLNRFVEVEDNPAMVKFISDPTSKIFNAEEGLAFPKRLVSRDKLKLSFLSSNGTGNEQIDEWLNENVAFWVYVFVDPTKNYKVSGGTLTANETKSGRTSYFSYRNPFKGATNCISYPIYKNPYFNTDNPANSSNVIIISSGYIMGEAGREGFEALNNDKSYYYSVKISCLPPFDARSTPMTIDEKNNLVIRQSANGNIDHIFGPGAYNSLVSGIKTSNSFGVFWGSYQWKQGETVMSYINSYSYSLPENGAITKSDITKSQSPSLALNPKLNGQTFKELIISVASGDTFTYDIQKLVEDSIMFEYSEPITPEVTKYYMRVKGGTGLYLEGTDENYTGLVGSTDNGLAFANDQYAAFIANNKNFYLQSNMKIGIGAIEGMAGGAKKAIGGDFAGGAYDIISSGIKAEIALIDRSLTVDNMKNAPDQLKNANGNVIFNMFSTELGLYVEKHSALEGDLKTANDFMNLYGFTFSSVANVRDYVHIRKYHNYIKAQLQSINGNMSNIAREDLRQRFAKGIRFWNSDTVEYKYENYELWLE